MTVPETVPVTTTPSPPFPETSVSPGRADPTTLPAPVEIRTPTDPLAMTAVPAALVPMRLPAIVLAFASATVISTPYWSLPEITLMRCEESILPMTLFAELEIRIPSPPLGTAAVPAALTPM